MGHNPQHPSDDRDDRIEQLFLRYHDLVTSQADALHTGDLSRATLIAGVAEAVLLDCQRLLRHMPPGNTGLNRKIERLVSTVRTSTADIGAQLKSHREELLAEIRSIEANAVGPTSVGAPQPRPSLINIRT